MQSVSTIGLDIAKSVFEVPGVDGAAQVVVRRQLKRRHVLAFSQKLLERAVDEWVKAGQHAAARQTRLEAIQ